MGPVDAAAFSDDSVNPRRAPTAVAPTVPVDAWITVAGPPPRPSTAGAQACRDGEPVPRVDRTPARAFDNEPTW